MKPHDPFPFPPSDLLLGPVVALVGRANSRLSRYDGLLESLVNPDVLLSPLLMKEAELSSRIEGTIATANEVYQRQAGEEFEPEKAKLRQNAALLGDSACQDAVVGRDPVGRESVPDSSGSTDTAETPG